MKTCFQCYVAQVMSPEKSLTFCSLVLILHLQIKYKSLHLNTNICISYSNRLSTSVLKHLKGVEMQPGGFSECEYVCVLNTLRTSFFWGQTKDFCSRVETRNVVTKELKA